MAILFPIVRISCAGASADTAYDLLGLYMDSGPDEGTYVTSEEEFYKIARRFNRRLESRQFDEAMKVLRTIVPRRLRCMDKDLIAVNNGIFNYDTKQLEPFSPDIVFMTKSHVNYNQSAVNVIIHNDDDGTDWDVESLMTLRLWNCSGRYLGQSSVRMSDGINQHGYILRPVTTVKVHFAN